MKHATNPSTSYPPCPEIGTFSIRMRSAGAWSTWRKGPDGQGEWFPQTRESIETTSIEIQWFWNESDQFDNLFVGSKPYSNLINQIVHVFCQAARSPNEKRVVRMPHLWWNQLEMNSFKLRFDRTLFQGVLDSFKYSPRSGHQTYTPWKLKRTHCSGKCVKWHPHCSTGAKIANPLITEVCS